MLVPDVPTRRVYRLDAVLESLQTEATIRCSWFRGQYAHAIHWFRECAEKHGATFEGLVFVLNTRIGTAELVEPSLTDTYCFLNQF
jgi:hypothetical protein